MASADEAVAAIIVEVVYCAGPRKADCVTLRLPQGARALDAVRASGLVERHGLDLQALGLGIWGHACDPQQGLRERDRVEVLRPLQVDPKQARRLRYKGKASRGRGVSDSRTP